jgi:hypothetical protein
MVLRELALVESSFWNHNVEATKAEVAADNF